MRRAQVELHGRAAKLGAQLAGEAQRAALIALEAERSGADLAAARAEAEILLKEADRANKTANKIERAPTGLRTVWHAEISDRRAALNHYLKTAPEEFVATIQRLADQDIRAGVRNIPGITAIEERKAV